MTNRLPTQPVNRTKAMPAMSRWLAIPLVALIFFIGCDNRPEPIEPATGTPAEIFVAEQGSASAPTETPHGAIDLATVIDTDEGRVRYRTVSGELFEVELETAADGTHRWVNLHPVAEPN